MLLSVTPVGVYDDCHCVGGVHGCLRELHCLGRVFFAGRLIGGALYCIEKLLDGLVGFPTHRVLAPICATLRMSPGRDIPFDLVKAPER